MTNPRTPTCCEINTVQASRLCQLGFHHCQDIKHECYRPGSRSA